MKTLDVRVLKSTAKNVLFIQLRQVLVAALGASPLWQADSSAATCGILTGDRTQAPCTGGLESQPLGHQGSLP